MNSALYTMRISRPPARFSQEEFVAKPRRIQLFPSEGEPAKYAGILRLPELAIRRSRIPKAGNGLFLNEKVRQGQVFAVYRRKIISEKHAKELKKKVAQLFTVALFVWL